LANNGDFSTLLNWLRALGGDGEPIWLVFDYYSVDRQDAI
jgi:hypothetical protein